MFPALDHKLQKKVDHGFQEPLSSGLKVDPPENQENMKLAECLVKEDLAPSMRASAWRMALRYCCFIIFR